MALRHLLLAVAFLAVTSPAPAREPYIDTSDPSRQTAEGLFPIRNSRAEVAFAKPGVDLRSYEEFILDPVEITYREGQRARREPGSARRARSRLNDEETAEMRGIFNEIFAGELRKVDRFAVVEEPGTHALRLTPAIVDLVINVPLDEAPMRSRVYVDSVAEMTLLLEFRDSVTGELLAQVADRREARSAQRMQVATPVNSRREVERLLRYWARVLAERLEQITGEDMATR